MKQKNLHAYGYHVVHAALKRSPDRCQVLYLHEGKKADAQANTLMALAGEAGVSVQFCALSVLDKLSEAGVHQGFVLQTRAPLMGSESDLIAHAQGLLSDTNHWPCYLVLEGVTDPHNFGACLRTSAAAGVAGVIVGRHDQARLSPVALKASSGAGFSLPLFEVVNLTRAIKSLQELGYWAIATALGDQAQSLYSLDLTGPLLWVMGAEGRGLRRLTLETCDFMATIPMTEAVGSLNVSVAAAVAIYESLRQRKKAISDEY